MGTFRCSAGERIIIGRASLTYEVFQSKVSSPGRLPSQLPEDNLTLDRSVHIFGRYRKLISGQAWLTQSMTDFPEKTQR